jgi:hypothetical protein
MVLLGSVDLTPGQVSFDHASRGCLHNQIVRRKQSLVLDMVPR